MHLQRGRRNCDHTEQQGRGHEHQTEPASGRHRLFRRRPPQRRAGGGSGCRRGRDVYRWWGPGGFTVADDGNRPLNRVPEIQDELPIFLGGHQLQQIHHVRAVQLRRLDGQAARQVGVADDRHAVVGYHRPILDRALDVAAVFGGHVDDHIARLHRCHHLRGDDPRSRTARDQRGGDDDVDVLALLGVQLRLAGFVVFAHLLGVAGARYLRLGRFDRQILPAKGFDLIGYLRSRVGREYDGAQAACRADRRQTGDTRAHDENLGRRNLPRGGHLTGEQSAEDVGGLDDRAVTRDVGHRGQHIQRLRPRDPGHRIHRQRREPALGEVCQQIRVEGRRQYADERCARPHPVALRDRRRVYTQNDVGPAGVLDRDPRLDVHLVGERRRGPGTRVDDDVVPELDQLGDRCRCRRHACFAGSRLQKNTDDHDVAGRLTSLASPARRPPGVTSATWSPLATVSTGISMSAPFAMGSTMTGLRSLNRVDLGHHHPAGGG